MIAEGYWVFRSARGSWLMGCAFRGGERRQTSPKALSVPVLITWQTPSLRFQFFEGRRLLIR